jgi:hypothetical protein
MKRPLLTLLTFITLIYHAYAQCSYKENVPEELVRERYSPDDSWYGNPYTMFNKRRGGWSLDDDLNAIRNSIIAGGAKAGQQEELSNHAARLYYGLYKNAIEAEPAKCSYDKWCKHPAWVKNNAIVHLLGIKPYLDGNGDRQFMFVPSEFDTWRYNFALKANDGMKNLNPRIISCYGFGDCDVLKDKAFELINYLQAYDMLKTAKYYKQGDGDRNAGDCSARNKIREYARNMHIQAEDVINSFAGWKRNHGIICASSIGLASIVLNDAGVETKWGRGLFGFLWGEGFHIPRPNYSPKNWQRRADGTDGGYSWTSGEDGIEDNMFHGRHIFPFRDVPQTSPSGSAGYAEGPGYASYTFQALMPYMRAYANYISPSNTKYLNDPRYKEIFTWYQNIAKQNEQTPTYDNSNGQTNVLGVLGMEEWPGTSAPVGDVTDMRGDLLLSMGGGSISGGKNYQGDTYINGASGNAVIRTKGEKGNYYFQMLFERGYSVDRVANPAEIGHEDDDFGTFLLGVDNEWLAIDPPYMSSPFQVYTRELSHHNYACFDTDDAEFEDPEISSSATGFKLSYKQVKDYFIYKDLLGVVDRSVNVYKTNGFVYYMLNDHFSGGSAGSVSMAINGNGRAGESSFVRSLQPAPSVYHPDGRVYKWTHPCRFTERKWALMAHTAITTGGTVSITETSSGTEHGTSEFAAGQGHTITDYLGKKTQGEKTSGGYGLHTRIEVKQDASDAIIQTLLMPYNCSDFLPLIDRAESGSAVATTLRFFSPTDTVVTIPGLAKTAPATVPDTTRDVHMSVLTPGPFSLVNPFGIEGSTAELSGDAEKVFMSRSDFVFERPGACTPSHIAFKQAGITNGTRLEYDDTTYIESGSPVTVHYEYAGKFRYTGSVTTGSGTSITFFLPDLQRMYQMRGIKEGKYALSTTHPYTAGNDSFRYVTIFFTPGTTNFSIELADPCLADCYFPPTDETIDSTFIFDLGDMRTLGHDLDVVAPAGFLSITEASKMSICPDFVLVNKDSIILIDSMCRDKKPSRSLQGDGLQVTVNNTSYLGGTRDFSNRNVIIVNDRAGLVLDSGSFTQVGTFGTLLVRKGGTLIVKKGATVVIGSSCEDDRGELIAENGAYVCIEDSSDIHFYNDIDSLRFALGKDTIDRHIVFISQHAVDPARAGVNTLGGNGKFRPASNPNEVLAGVGRWASNNCLRFCDWKYVNLPYGVNNREFGWCNVSYPRSSFTINTDTLCINGYIVMHAAKTLNETSFNINVCTYDTGTQSCIATVKDTSGICNDSIRVGNGILVFKATAPGHYRVRLIARNDCNERDTTYRIVYVVPDPVVQFTLKDTLICPGYGTLTANGGSSYSGLLPVKHEWGITRLFDSTYLDDQFTSMSWLNDSASAVDTAFKFPGYRFVGGYSYLVALTVKGRCKTFTMYDTVHVPLKAYIDIDSAMSYKSPVGPAPVLLRGVVAGAASWSWNPAVNLSAPLSLTTYASPVSSQTYVLTATGGGCTARDTVFIRRNQYSYAGYDTSICVTDSIVLGTNYNAAVFLGYLNYSSNGALSSLYSSYGGLQFEKHFTGYMIRRLASMYGSTPLIGTFISIDSTRRYIQSRPWFPAYYRSFVSSDASMGTLNTFVTRVNSDMFIKSRLDAVNAKGKWNGTTVSQIFTNYRSYYQSSLYNSLRTLWSQMYTDTGTVWSSRPDGTDYFNIIVSRPENRTYRIRVTDNTIGLVEFDEATVYQDNRIAPAFGIGYFTDSTVYFSNYTSPDHGWNTYRWNFGDGSPVSTSRHPSHTFPAFDSAYRVCLTVYTMCGDSQVCDTVRIDSTLLAYGGLGKTGDLSTGEVSSFERVMAKQFVQSGEHYLSVNVPNPFNDLSVVTYGIYGAYKQAAIRITNMLGQEVGTYALPQSQGTIMIDGSVLKRGMYYYSLVIDGAVHGSKAMIIER